MSQHFSITEFLRRLDKLRTIEDFAKSKSYFTTVLSQLDRDINFRQELDNLLKLNKPLNIIKQWACSNLVQKANLNQNQIYRFIRSEYLDKGNRINEPFASFYNKYAEGKEAPYTKQAVSRFLRVLEIKAKNKKYGKLCAYLNVPSEELFNAFSNLGLD